MSKQIYCPHCAYPLSDYEIIRLRCANCYGKLRIIEKEEKAEMIGKPFGPFKSFNDCLSHMTKPKSEGGGGYDDEIARKVCGRLQSELGEK